MSPNASAIRRFQVDLWICLGFLALSLIYAAPLLEDLTGTLPHDPGDPALNTWILLHNSRVLPFSQAWLDPLIFFPSVGALTFSEHLLGLAPIAWPVTALTGSPVLTYNVVFLLSFALSAIGAYWLVREITGSVAGGIVAGLAFGFSPYRASQLAHIQVLASFWMPLVLVGLHRYLKGGQARWLVLFVVAWLLQVLTNGHYLFFFGIVVGAWLVWHAARRNVWRRGVTLTMAWTLATGVAVLTYLPYQSVHEIYGMTRLLTEIQSFSAPVEALAYATSELWLWGRVLPSGPPETQLFPGLTLCVLIGAGLALRRRPDALVGWSRSGQVLLGLAGAMAATVVVSVLVGPWRASLLGLTVSVNDLSKPVSIACVLAALALATPRGRRNMQSAWRARSSTAFFLLAAGICWLISLGPTPSLVDERWLYASPYRVLMLVPGVDALRVPARVWMPATLMLSAAAGVLWAGLMSRRQRLTGILLTAVASAGLLADGWVHPFRVAAAPEQTYGLLSPRPDRVILEVPFGEPWRDAAAMLRAAMAGLPTANGYSGHRPPHQEILRTAIGQCDLSVLDGLARFGDLTIIADTERMSNDCVGRLTDRAARTTSAANGRVLAEIDQPPRSPEWPTSRAITPVLVTPSVNAHLQLALTDDNVSSRWNSSLQRPGDRLSLDLGAVYTPVGLELTLGSYIHGYPRALTVDSSADGLTWTPVASLRGAPAAFEAAVADPRRVAVRIALRPIAARYLRLTQIDRNDRYEWSVAELAVHVRQ